MHGSGGLRARHRQAADGARRDLDRRLRRGDGGARRRGPDDRRDHRRNARPGGAGRVRGGLPGPHHRCRHRRAARRHQRSRARHGRAEAGREPLCDLPQPGVRPGADGCRPAQAARDITLDRAGVTGSDGPSHNGMWDLSFLQLVPGHRGRRPARRARPSGRSCARPLAARSGRASSAIRKRLWERTFRRSARPGQSMYFPRRRPATCC